jgi:integrase
MRIREAFTVYRRRLPSGAAVFYYRTYDDDGKRKGGFSTGQRTRSAAREFCCRLLREGKLLTKKAARVPTFAEFAEGWWDFETCAYLKGRAARRKMSESYASTGRLNLKNYLLPAFGKWRLDLITEGAIDGWMMDMLGRGYKHGTVNLAIKILSVMLGQACRKKYIAANPCEVVELLSSDDEKKIDILTPDEVVRLFPRDWESVWTDRLHYVLNKLAACTGMRHGELLGLRGEFVYETYIDVCAQYNQYGYTDTKTHKPRNIPVPKTIREDLDLLIRENGAGYIFSVTRGEKPVSRAKVYTALYAALEKIGIDGERRKKRNLSMHGWRHFFNTTLVMANVNDNKVRSVTGHTSAQMTKRYLHLKNDELSEVREVQERLVAPAV